MDESWIGYSSRDPKRVQTEVRAIYEQLQDLKSVADAGEPTYVLEPCESTSFKQRIRLAHEVFQFGEGLAWIGRYCLRPVLPPFASIG